MHIGHKYIFQYISLPLALSRDFLTECLFPSPTRPYELPWEQKTIWAIVFGLMMFVAIAGNGIVLWIVTGKFLPASHSLQVAAVLETSVGAGASRIRRVCWAQGRARTLTGTQTGRQPISGANAFVSADTFHVLTICLFLSYSPIRLMFLNRRWAAGHRSMRTVTNYFLLNLSIADLLMSSLNCVFNFIFMLNSDWPFGSIYCTINNFVANVTVSTSVFTLVAISFDRWVRFVWILAA